MLAAVAAGRIADLRQAAALVSGKRQTLQPAPGRKAVYDDAYARYRRLFAALKPLYEALRARGLASTEAFVILGRKLLRAAYAVWKTGRSFDLDTFLGRPQPA